MLCRDFTAKATELMEGTLGWRQRLAMRLHLAVCDACRAFLRQMHDAVRLLAALPPKPPTPGTEAQILTTLHKATPPPP